MGYIFANLYFCSIRFCLERTEAACFSGAAGDALSTNEISLLVYLLRRLFAATFLWVLCCVFFRLLFFLPRFFCLETEVFAIASCMDAMTSSGFSHQSIVQMRQMFQPSAFNTLFWTISRSRAVFVRL